MFTAAFQHEGRTGLICIAVCPSVFGVEKQDFDFLHKPRVYDAARLLHTGFAGLTRQAV